jgi:DNA-binding IclR family transcriptional regulator
MSRSTRADWSLDELAREARLAKATAHRLLQTLAAAGFVEHSTRPGHYRLGLQSAVVGNAAIGSRDGDDAVAQVLGAVSTRTRETAGIVVLSHQHAVTVARVQPGQLTTHGDGVVRVFPAYASAGGKALLTELSESELRSLYAGCERFPPLTANTVPDISTLLEQVDEIRQLGYALDDEEARVGQRCLAVPIHTSHGVRHCLAVAASAECTPLSRLKVLVPLLQTAARELSTRMESSRMAPPLNPAQSSAG